MIRMLVTALGAATLLLLGAGAIDARAQANADYDVFGGVAWDNDAKWTSAATMTRTFTFNNATFTEGEEYNTTPITFTCASGWAAKTAWIRFSTEAKGRLALSINSSANAYDVSYNVFEVPFATAPPGAALITQLKPINCLNERKNGLPDEAYSFQGGEVINAGTTVYVQVASVCVYRDGDFPCTAQERAGAKGGPTTVQLNFDPDDSPDEDGVPNPIDACPDQDGIVGGKPGNGCPDADGDGVTEPADACPGVKGFDGTGCRKADNDEDGFAAKDRGGADCNDDNAAISPGDAEQPGNSVDENCDDKDYTDVDGDSDPQDCDDANAKINHGVEEVKGNKVDENCDDTAAPFPALQNLFRFESWTIGSTVVGLQEISITDPRKGMRVRVTCDGGGCPFGLKTYSVRKDAKQFVFAKEFARTENGEIRQLTKGTRVTVTLSRRGFIGTARRYTVRKKGDLGVEEFCSEAGSRKLRKKCTGRS